MVEADWGEKLVPLQGGKSGGNVERTRQAADEWVSVKKGIQMSLYLDGQ